MAIYTKVSGASKSVTDAKVKVGGAWKQVNSIHTKVNGVWKEVWNNIIIASGLEFTVTEPYISYPLTYPQVTSSIRIFGMHISCYDSSGRITYEDTADNLKIQSGGFNLSNYGRVQISVDASKNTITFEFTVQTDYYERVVVSIDRIEKT